MALSAMAYSKACKTRRICAVTTSVGPGATNMVTAAACAHTNRIPLLLLPGDIFATRRPHPVLQQLEDVKMGYSVRSISDINIKIQFEGEVISYGTIDISC
jgi:3D-(3,5/4)-trihydroxycyclohexane-1,2-dione acylhydrolase (decyclizing)